MVCERNSLLWKNDIYHLWCFFNRFFEGYGDAYVQELGDDNSRGYLHENNVVEVDRIERVESCEATLNPLCFDYAIKDVLDSDGLALACQVVHDSEDGTEFVRWVCPL
jgi:hypothetical protein